ncbi:MAG: hypothetical protein JJU20_04460 [Opitutales bacterium]|nr:hypothetical protein [Opitutales bacterium]
MDRTRQSQFRTLIEKRLEEIEKQLREGSENTAAIAPDKAIGRLSRLDSMQMQQMALAAKQRLDYQPDSLFCIRCAG